MEHIKKLIITVNTIIQRSNEMTLEELKEHYMPIIELSVTRTKEHYEAQLKAKDEEIERLFGLITSLWQIIDDIDTYGDIAKSNDALFRSLVEKKQKERWKLPITTDGYEIMLKDKV